MATISAHDTTPGHALSTELLILSTTSNPLTEFKLGRANFSPLLVSNSIDASQPYALRVEKILLIIYDTMRPLGCPQKVKEERKLKIWYVAC